MLHLTNTLSRSKEAFKPFTDGKVSVYQCGPTVYWTQHVGNLRAVVVGDVIVRTLEYLGHDVTFVRNYTDVGHLTSDEDAGEDKMDKAAAREGKRPADIAARYRKQFEEDARALNVRWPDRTPSATEYIETMQRMIQTLLDSGHAYQTELAVYFDVTKAEDYTRLSRQKLEKNLAGAGAGEVSDPAKRNPQDFALWFFKKGAHANALQTWPSPWGEGFPGWHIECSAMIQELLGETIDIHIGGIEHIPVHHTNEIAQSEAAHGGAPLAQYWLHNEHLTVDGAKMSKSEGTAYSLEEVKAKGFDPLALRYFFLQAHYRSKQNFTWEALAAAQTALDKIRAQVAEWKGEGETSALFDESSRKRFIEALEDDFNTPQAVAVLWELIKDDAALNSEKLATALDFDRVLGLGLADVPAVASEVPEDVQALIDNRNKFRELGDFEAADEIRQQLEELGYAVKDAPEGTKVKKKGISNS